jgi:chromosome segregation ATPase
MADDQYSQPLSLGERLEFVKGQLVALEKQVERGEDATSRRIDTIETKLDRGFEGVSEKFKELATQTTDIAMRLARGQGALGFANRLATWVVPALVGGLVTLILFHAGVLRP